MSKDGDWILREDDETTQHVLSVLDQRGAIYRYGAPLDLRWLAGGWSSHFEMRQGGLRLRADFVTRPPRSSRERLAEVWRRVEGDDVPVLDLVTLARIKATRREKDWPVIGELARRMDSIRDRLLYSRSARELREMAAAHPDAVAALVPSRPLLDELGAGREKLEAALDAERRAAMREDEERLARYVAAARAWQDAWPELRRQIDGLALRDAHDVMVHRAEGLLPFAPEAT
jgi:hypothetical protein